MTVTGKTPVIVAPLICEPTTTTSSTFESSDSCAKKYVVKINGSTKNIFFNIIIPFLTLFIVI